MGEEGGGQGRTHFLGLDKHGPPRLEGCDSKRGRLALDGRDQATLARVDDIALEGLVRLEDVVERALTVDVVVEL